MDPTFYFCKDGVLRMAHEKGIMVDVQYIITSRYEGDQMAFWLDWRGANAKIEKGVCGAQFLQCLEPFEEFWARWLKIDLQAFIVESKRPISANKAVDFSELQISWHSTMSDSAEYKRESQEFSAKDFFSSQSRRSPFVRLDRYITMTGYKNDQEHYSTSGLAMNEIANVPITLASHEVVLLTCLYSEPQEKFFSPQSPQVHTTSIYNKDFDKSYTYEYLLTEEADYSITDVVEGFCSDMDATPQSRDEFTQSIKQAMLSIDRGEMMEIANFEDENTQLKSRQSQDGSNVVPLFASNDSDSGEGEVEELEDKNSSRTIKSVSLQPGAFEPLIESLQRKSGWWQVLSEEFEKQAKLVRLAGAQEAVSDPKVQGVSIDRSKLKWGSWKKR